MKVAQYPYLSPEASRLRERDGVPPWGVHPCEVDSVSPAPGTALHAAWLEACRMRTELEGAGSPDHDETSTNEE